MHLNTCGMNDAVVTSQTQNTLDIFTTLFYYYSSYMCNCIVHSHNSFSLHESMHPLNLCYLPLVPISPCAHLPLCPSSPVPISPCIPMCPSSPVSISPCAQLPICPSPYVTVSPCVHLPMCPSPHVPAFLSFIHWSLSTWSLPGLYCLSTLFHMCSRRAPPHTFSTFPFLYTLPPSLLYYMFSHTVIPVLRSHVPFSYYNNSSCSSQFIHSHHVCISLTPALIGQAYIQAHHCLHSTVSNAVLCCNRES